MTPHEDLGEGLPPEEWKKRILIVDDDPLVHQSLEGMLASRQVRWEVAHSSSSREAFACLQKLEFDVVVAAIGRPNLDGFDLLRRMGAERALRDLPVIVLTADAEPGLKSAVLDLGATDLLAKPIECSELIARLRNTLRIKRYQDEIKARNEHLERTVAERTGALERARIELVWRLGRAGEFRDTDTGNHVIRVGHYSRQLATALGLDKIMCQRIFLTSPLHDIGKIGIPDAILLKGGALTGEEWRIMQTHASIGARILREDILSARCFDAMLAELCDAGTEGSGNPLIEMAANIAGSHHERWDGSGYPKGLSGEDIPLEARITIIADIYDALSSKRPYKEALPEKQVLHILASGKGTYFDPQVHAAFERSVDIFRDIYEEFRDEHSPPPIEIESLADLAGAC